MMGRQQLGAKKSTHIGRSGHEYRRACQGTHLQCTLGSLYWIRPGHKLSLLSSLERRGGGSLLFKLPVLLTMSRWKILRTSQAPPDLLIRHTPLPPCGVRFQVALQMQPLLLPPLLHLFSQEGNHEKWAHSGNSRRICCAGLGGVFWGAPLDWLTLSGLLSCCPSSQGCL